MTRDYGYYWSDNPRSFPRYRVSWDEETGLLSALNLATLEVEDFCCIKDRGRIDSLMEGWADHIYDPCSLEWIRKRCMERADELAGIGGTDA